MGVHMAVCMNGDFKSASTILRIPCAAFFRVFPDYKKSRLHIEFI
jgi:hypothetical protein